MDSPRSALWFGWIRTADGAGGKRHRSAATFAVLVSFPLVITLHIGLVVPIGILVDTFVVRTLLVPALTVHIGRSIWWPARRRKADGGLMTASPAAGAARSAAATW